MGKAHEFPAQQQHKTESATSKHTSGCFEAADGTRCARVCVCVYSSSSVGTWFVNENNPLRFNHSRYWQREEERNNCRLPDTYLVFYYGSANFSEGFDDTFAGREDVHLL